MTEPTTADEGVSIEAGDDGVLRIRLDRPELKNSLGSAAIRRIVVALEAAATDDRLRAVVITGAGPDFCSGADWVATNTGATAATGTTGPAPGATSDTPATSNTPATSVTGATGAGGRPRSGSIQRRMAVEAHRLIELLLELQLPVVCAVRGWAAGLGCQIALAADFTVATASSRFWLPFIKRGFSADSGATWLVPRLVGVARAKELLLLGRPVTGVDAAAWGMIHRAVPDDELDTAVTELAAELAGAATVAVGLTKRGIHRSLETGLSEAMEHEAAALELSSRTVDFKEGLRAFKERRDPRFEGR